MKKQDHAKFREDYAKFGEDYSGKKLLGRMLPLR